MEGFDPSDQGHWSFKGDELFAAGGRHESTVISASPCIFTPIPSNHNFQCNIYIHINIHIYIHINLYHATRIFPWKRITFDFQLANWWIFHRFRLNHRGFAIRPRLAYFPRVRSPRPQGKGEGCTPSPPSLLPSSLPRGSVPPTVGGTCAVRATVNHVAATWSPKESGGGGGWLRKKAAGHRGDEYRPRARARACVYDARFPSRNSSRDRFSRFFLSNDYISRCWEKSNIEITSNSIYKYL